MGNEENLILVGPFRNVQGGIWILFDGFFCLFFLGSYFYCIPLVPVIPYHCQEMLSAVASPWLPALQALARRRLALGPSLDAARQRRENAAVEIQRRVRGTTVRHNMDAENLVLAVLKAHSLKTRSVFAAGASILKGFARLPASI